jgi:hypothetical protein
MYMSWIWQCIDCQHPHLHKAGGRGRHCLLGQEEEEEEECEEASGPLPSEKCGISSLLSVRLQHAQTLVPAYHPNSSALPGADRTLAPPSTLAWQASSGVSLFDRTQTWSIQLPELVQNAGAPWLHTLLLLATWTCKQHSWLLVHEAGEQRRGRSAACPRRTLSGHCYLLKHPAGKGCTDDGTLVILPV